MPIVTLADLRAQVYSGVENNSLFYTQDEVDDHANEGVVVMNLATGFLQATGTVAASSSTSILTVPTGVLFALRVLYAGRALEKSSLAQVGHLAPTWMNETTNDTQTPVTYWFPIGCSKFGIYPRPAVGGATITVVGVAEPTALVNGTDQVAYPSEFSDILESYATDALQLKAGGIVARTAAQHYQTFLGRLTELKRYKAKIAPQFFVEVAQEK